MSALYGPSQDAETKYQLSNLRVTYRSIADSKDPSKVIMGTVHNIKSNILSGTASVSANVPAVCDSVAMSFIQNQHENVPVYDSHKLENVEDISEVQYIFNDQTNSLITYSITDETEILDRFLDAMNETSHNQVSIDKFRANSSWCCGLNFEAPIDLSQNRFTLQITSGVNNAYPVNVFMYFFSSVEI